MLPPCFEFPFNSSEKAQKLRGRGLAFYRLSPCNGVLLIEFYAEYKQNQGIFHSRPGNSEIKGRLEV